MTNKEAPEILRHAANRRLMVHVNGVPHKMEPDEIDMALQMAIEALERDKWISVKDTLPEPGTDVLTYVQVADDESRIGAAHFDRGVWWDAIFNVACEAVTHWMPLPKPPNEERGDY